MISIYGSSSVACTLLLCFQGMFLYGWEACADHTTSVLDSIYSQHITASWYMLQMILPHMVDHTFMDFPVPLQTLWTPWTIFVPLTFPRSSLKIRNKLQGHDHTYGIEPEAIEWFFIRDGWCHDVSSDDLFLNVPNEYNTRCFLWCEHIEICSPDGCKAYSEVPEGYSWVWAPVCDPEWDLSKEGFLV